MPTCAHCGHTRLRDEVILSSAHCPSCGIAYGQRVDLHSYQVDDRPKPAGIARGLLIAGGLVGLACAAVILGMDRFERPARESVAVPASNAPVTVSKPQAPAPVVAAREEVAREQERRRLDHELWLSLTFGKRLDKEFAQIEATSPKLLEPRLDALRGMARDWNEMLLSVPCLADAKPLLAGAIERAYESAAAKLVSNPDHASLALASAEEYARFVDTVTACKAPDSAVAEAATSPDPLVEEAPRSTNAAARSADQEKFDGEFRLAQAFSQRWDTEMARALELARSPGGSTSAMFARGEAFSRLQQDWKQLELRDPCLAGSRPLYDDSLKLALSGVSSFFRGKAQFTAEFSESANQQGRFTASIEACRNARQN